MGVALDKVMAVHLDAVALQPLLEGRSGRLAIVVGYDNGAYHEVAFLKFLTQAQYILVVCDAEVCAFLIFLNVRGTDYDDYLYAVTELLQHPQLTVWLKSRKYTACMVVIKQFAAKLEVQFAIKLGDSFSDVLRLYVLIFLVVKSYFHNGAKLHIFLHPSTSILILFPTNTYLHVAAH